MLFRSLTLVHGDFSGATPEAALIGWIAQGNVRANGGVVTLGESTSGTGANGLANAAGQASSAVVQTHLAQLFMLNPGDRALTFTVDARSLAAHPNATGPADAFEVALLDASTGLPLLGTTGLSHTDALLNIQAKSAAGSGTGIGNGTGTGTGTGTTTTLRERTASSVRRQVNADGSTTYTLDLPANLAADPDGTPVLLSFDLLGFAGAGSEVTLREVQVLGAPLARPDAFSGDEDTTIAGNVVANDLTLRSGSGAGVSISATTGSTTTTAELTAAPIHGHVSLGADGSFRYVPEANYFGGGGC